MILSSDLKTKTDAELVAAIRESQRLANEADAQAEALEVSASEARAKASGHYNDKVTLMEELFSRRNSD